MNNPITDQYGTKFWYNNKKELHRDDGPAIEHLNGYQAWYIHDLCHREDGPAMIYSNGDQEWYIRGKRINVKSQQDFERYLKLKAFW